MLIAEAVTVTPTAVVLVAAREGRDDQHSLTIVSNDSTIWLGAADVSTVNGLPLLQMQHFNIDMGAEDELWAVCSSASGTADVRVLRQI